MTVFVLVWHEGHRDRGHEVKGVYATEALAKAAEARLWARGVPTVYPGDWFSILDFEVEAEEDFIQTFDHAATQRR